MFEFHLNLPQKKIQLLSWLQSSRFTFNIWTPWKWILCQRANLPKSRVVVSWTMFSICFKKLPRCGKPILLTLRSLNGFSTNNIPKSWIKAEFEFLLHLTHCEQPRIHVSLHTKASKNQSTLQNSKKTLWKLAYYFNFMLRMQSWCGAFVGQLAEKKTRNFIEIS